MQLIKIAKAEIQTRYQLNNEQWQQNYFWNVIIFHFEKLINMEVVSFVGFLNEK